MQKRSWAYAQNVFLNQTTGSHKKALILFEDCFSKFSQALQQDPNLAPIHALFKPAYLDYKDAYAEKDKVQNYYSAYTGTFEAKLDEIGKKIRYWEAAVRVVFVEDSPEEKMLFPHKRSPFLASTYENRISAVFTLERSLADFPQLAATHLDVSRFYQDLSTARQKQQEYEGLNDQKSRDLEAKRLAACQALHGAMGYLIYYYHQDPNKITDFFDLSLLRSNNSNEPTALLSGRVSDSEGQPITSAIIKMVELEEELSSDSNGEFFAELPAGSYTVEIRAAGYISQYINNFVLDKNLPREADFVLDKAR